MGSFDVIMVALRFNEKINARNLEGLYNLMTEDHIFIDSENDVDEGKAVMTERWRNFASFPDYRNIFTQVIVRENRVIMVGYSTCSYGPLDGPAIWTANVRNGLISEWRIYKDTEKNRENLSLIYE